LRPVSYELNIANVAEEHLATTELLAEADLRYGGLDR